MSRSQQSQQLALGNQMVGTENANAASAVGTAMPAYQNIVKNPGYTDPQKTAITGATEGGVGAAFGSEMEGAANRAARTNNSAGLTSTQDALARQRMITSGNLGAQNETNFANNAQGQQQMALQGLGGIFGQSTGAANSTMGVNAGNARTPGFWDQFGNTVAGGLGKAVVPSFG